MMRTLFSVAVAMLSLGGWVAALAQEITIGHLEAVDDTGINWLWYHCNQRETTLKCDVFQSLVIDGQNGGACGVLNDYSTEMFLWDKRTESWTSHEGPVGPCGRVTVGVLEPDPHTKQFWQYTMKKFNTNGAARLPNGKSCDEAVPGVTLHYTWKAAASPIHCASIRNLMH